MSKENKIKRCANSCDWPRCTFADCRGKYPELLAYSDKQIIAADIIPFRLCGEGDNICNCKSKSECGYNNLKFSHE